jgi:flagellar protein FliO/FliZ
MRFSPLLFIAAASPVWAAAPAAASSPVSTAGSLFQVIFGLMVVLAVMAAVAWLLKRTGAGRLHGAQPVKIVGGVSVGTRERVMVLEVGESWIVVGVAPGRINSLATLPRQEMPAENSPSKGKIPFADWLKQTIDKRNAG